jgi:hypothetical protein
VRLEDTKNVQQDGGSIGTKTYHAPKMVLLGPVQSIVQSNCNTNGGDACTCYPGVPS